MTRPQDERLDDRSARAVILQIGTIKAVGTSTLDIDVPGPGGVNSTLTGIAQLSTFTGTVGARVAVLMDSVRALCIGPIK